MSAAKLREACTTWREMHKLYLRMQNTAMQLFQHPDATDEQIVQVARKLGELRQKLTTSRRQIINHKDYRAITFRHGIEGFKL